MKEVYRDVDKLIVLIGSFELIALLITEFLVIKEFLVTKDSRAIPLVIFTTTLIVMIGRWVFLSVRDLIRNGYDK